MFPCLLYKMWVNASFVRPGFQPQEMAIFRSWRTWKKQPTNQPKLCSVCESISNVTNVHNLRNLLRDMYRKRILFSVLNSEFICAELCLCRRARARIQHDCSSSSSLPAKKHPLQENSIFLGICFILFAKQGRKTRWCAPTWQVATKQFSEHTSQMLYGNERNSHTKWECIRAPKKTYTYTQFAIAATNQSDFVNNFHTWYMQRECEKFCAKKKRETDKKCTQPRQPMNVFIS